MAWHLPFRRGGLFVTFVASAFATTFVALPSAAAAECSASASMASARKAAASARRYSGLLERQKIELRKTRAMHGRNLCGLRSTASCKTLDRAIERMTAKVTELEGSVADLRRKSKVANRAAKRCRSPKRVAVKERQQIVRIGSTEEPSAPVVAEAVPTVATICVRACDGYFFPISNAVPLDAAAEDAVRCAQLCPGAKTHLFTKAPAAPISEMVDRTGVPYSARPFAFRHQADDYQHNRSCSCDAASTGTTKSTNLRGTLTPFPSALAGGDADEETRRNVVVSFDWLKARAFARMPAEDGPRGDVRVVGRPFLSDR